MELDLEKERERLKSELRQLKHAGRHLIVDFESLVQVRMRLVSALKKVERLESRLAKYEGIPETWMEGDF